MTKKKRHQKSKAKKFDSSPFSSLKGSAVFEEERTEEKLIDKPQKQSDVSGSFADEMMFLGVKRIESNEFEAEEGQTESELPGTERQFISETQTDEELFQQSIGEMEVRFEDRFSVEDEGVPTASARRMKQLKQGKLRLEATLDLHGYQRVEVADKLRIFFQNAGHHGWRTLLVITGKGLHSKSSEPVLRNEVEQFLVGEGRKLVVEWGRAPKQYGGDGALVLFLRTK